MTLEYETKIYGKKSRLECNRIRKVKLNKNSWCFRKPLISKKRTRQWKREADQYAKEATDWLERPSSSPIQLAGAITSRTCRQKLSVVDVPITCHDKGPSFYKIPCLPPPIRCPESAQANWNEIGLTPINRLDMNLKRSAKTIHSGARYAIDFDSNAARSLSTAVFDCKKPKKSDIPGVQISYEMESRVRQHIEEYASDESFWIDEIASILASPLDASIFVGRECQLHQYDAAPSFEAFKKSLDGQMLDYDSSEYFYPYSSLAHQAATKINVAYKHHFARRVNFAISIQSFYRGWSVRCEIRELREYQTPYAIVVQCFIRQLVAKQQLISKRRMIQARHCVEIQRVYRGYCGRGRFNLVQQQRLDRTVSALQRIVRGFQARKLRRKLEVHHRLRKQSIRVLHRAARAHIIRSTSRKGRMLRFVVRYKIWIKERRRYLAAISIQRITRGFVGRRRTVKKIVELMTEEAVRLREEIKAMNDAGDKAAESYTEYLKSSAGKKELATETEKHKVSRKKTKRRAVVNAERDIVKNTFDIFDSDGSGSIDCRELAELMKQLCIPMTETELNAFFLVIDRDGSGDIDFEEFYTWWQGNTKHEAVNARLKLVKAKLKGQRWVADMTGATTRLKAKKVLLHKERMCAMTKARADFRLQRRPRYCCSSCACTFGILEDENAHKELNKCPKSDIVDLKRARQEMLRVVRLWGIPMLILNS